jgi:hypothetical protein
MTVLAVELVRESVSSGSKAVAHYSTLCYTTAVAVLQACSLNGTLRTRAELEHSL